MLKTVLITNGTVFFCKFVKTLRYLMAKNYRKRFKEEDLPKLKEKFVQEIESGKATVKALKNIDGCFSSAYLFRLKDPNSEIYDEEFAKKIEDAEEFRHAKLFEETLDIARNEEKDIIYFGEGENRRIILNNVKVARDKLLIGQINHYLSTLNSMKYAKNENHNHSGEVSMSMPTINIKKIKKKK